MSQMSTGSLKFTVAVYQLELINHVTLSQCFWTADYTSADIEIDMGHSRRTLTTGWEVLQF